MLMLEKAVAPLITVQFQSCWACSSPFKRCFHLESTYIIVAIPLLVKQTYLIEQNTY